jgi:hypothetical protein
MAGGVGSGSPGAIAVRRRRLVLALAVAALAGFVIGAAVGAGDGGDRTTDDAAAAPLTELPRGGRVVFPDHRVVAFYGAPQDPALGALGIGTPDAAGAELEKQARPYARPERPVLPAMELISTIAAQDPGERGDYNVHQPRSVIERYLKAARKRDALLLLDIQPGYADFLDEARRLERYLREPDVGLALDPEWHVAAPEIPGQVIGSVTADEVNEVSAYLDELVARDQLPQKLFVIHQFTEGMIADRDQLEPREGLAITLNSDGFGDIPNKEAKYAELSPRGQTREFDAGFKLFYLEDFPLMTPGQVLDLRPEPDLVVYE